MLPEGSANAGLGTPDIFFSTVTGLQEAASVVALLQTALVLAGYIGARCLLGRAPRQSAL